MGGGVSFTGWWQTVGKGAMLAARRMETLRLLCPTRECIRGCPSIALLLAYITSRL